MFCNSQDYSHITHIPHLHIRETAAGVALAVIVVAVQAGGSTAMIVARGAGIAHINSRSTAVIVARGAGIAHINSRNTAEWPGAQVSPILTPPL